MRGVNQTQPTPEEKILFPSLKEGLSPLKKGEREPFDFAQGYSPWTLNPTSLPSETKPTLPSLEKGGLERADPTILLFLPNKVVVDKPVKRDGEAENGNDLI